ncbi:MAG TPA: helix-turn-helix domain-containing protein [Sphingomicrobium sp.]|nr:helix-turn-helix domain-containing protein [Sphingomicrobium sp.]
MITLYSREADGGQQTSGQLVSHNKGVVIYHEGDSARHWYEVVSGTVRTCRFMGDGHRQLTGFFYSDDVFGVDRGYYRESAEAVTNVVLRRFAAASPEEVEATAGVQGRILERALERARECIFLFGHRTATNRVAAFLIAMAERSGAKNGLQIPMTRSDIADYLNLTLHTVSRTISEFAKKRLIALDGPQNIRILDLDQLRLVAGDGEDESGGNPEMRESA